MASDRTRARVEEFMGRAGLGDVSFGCADLCECGRCKRAWTALLDAFEREIERREGHSWDNFGHLGMWREARIAELAAQPTPEVKK